MITNMNIYIYKDSIFSSIFISVQILEVKGEETSAKVTNEPVNEMIAS